MNFIPVQITIGLQYQLVKMIAKVPLMENLLREENAVPLLSQAVPLVKPGSPGSLQLPVASLWEESALETANFLAMAVVSPRALARSLCCCPDLCCTSIRSPVVPPRQPTHGRLTFCPSLKNPERWRRKFTKDSTVSLGKYSFVQALRNSMDEKASFPNCV